MAIVYKIDILDALKAKGYSTYLLTYENGKQTNKEFIANTWYPK